MSSKARQTYEAEVIDVVHHQNGDVVDLYLRTPQGAIFSPSDGVGIPGAMAEKTLTKLKSLLKNTDNHERLIHHAGHAGPDYAAPSISFLARLLTKAKATIKGKCDRCPYSSVIKKHTACLQMALEDKDLTETLRANYSVHDLVELFPKVMDAQDIIDLQPKEHGNKTYTVDGRQSVIRNGVKCFRLNVTKDDGPAFRALFGEAPPKGTKPGQNSSYLRSLKAGDKITINDGLKPGPTIPEHMKSERPILLVAQGNAMIRMLSLLEDLKQRKDQGAQFGDIILVGSFKTKQDVLELEALTEYLDNGTLGQLHLCLSREDQPASFAHPKINSHEGIRVQKLFDKAPFKTLDDPFVLLSGGLSFYSGEGSVGEFLADRYTYNLDDIDDNKRTHNDMRVSKSSNRRHELQGQIYEALDPHIALKHFEGGGSAPQQPNHPKALCRRKI